MDIAQPYLESLLDQIKKNVPNPLSEAIEQAYLNTPRHLFVDRYLADRTENEQGEYDYTEVEITADNLEEHLPELYKDRAISLAANKKGEGLSSISQPTLVLMMLQELDIQEGHKVLEIGTASGWNAAMMSKLVGEKGAVYSIDILPDLVERAKTKIAQQPNSSNVHLFAGDGAITHHKTTFDRIMFTVGSYDIPSSIYEQLKDGGLLLMVLKNKGALDSKVLLRKTGDYLETIENSSCKFVSLKGAYEMSELDPKTLEELTVWEDLKDKVVHEESFWWGLGTKHMSRWKIGGITFFLGLSNPSFMLFRGEQYELFFGLLDKENNSLALWRKDRLTAYGNDIALQKLKTAFQTYFDLGMPSPKNFKFKAYPIDKTVKVEDNQWLVRLRDSQFLWSI